MKYPCDANTLKQIKKPSIGEIEGFLTNQLLT